VTRRDGPAWYKALIFLGSTHFVYCHTAEVKSRWVIPAFNAKADMVEYSRNTWRPNLTSSILPFLNPAISEMQETSYWPTHRWNVVSQQRKSDWQHPNSYYREREETEHAATDECDTSRHPKPFRTLPTKAVQVLADPSRDVLLEAIHFFAEIGNPRHRFIPMVARRSITAWEILEPAHGSP
jgi:hypothetical protein